LSFPLDSENAAIVVVDAAGHGRARAPLSSAISDAIAGALLGGASPAAALVCADDRLRTFADESPYAVVFATVINASRTVVYASAGHDLAFALRDDGCIHHLAPTAPMLGIPLAFRARNAAIALGTFETLVVATDGIADSRPAGSSDFFGAARAALVVERSLREGDDPARAMLDAAWAHGGARQADDIGVIVARAGAGGRFMSLRVDSRRIGAARSLRQHIAVRGSARLMAPLRGGSDRHECHPNAERDDDDRQPDRDHVADERIAPVA
jgi:serine phosphatase RsbU (regulator of sigma subunit)